MVVVKRFSSSSAACSPFNNCDEGPFYYKDYNNGDLRFIRVFSICIQHKLYLCDLYINIYTPVQSSLTVNSTLHLDAILNNNQYEI